MHSSSWQRVALLLLGLAWSVAPLHASAADSGDVLCTQGGNPWVICTGKGSIEFAYARAESVDGRNYVDLTVYDQDLVCDVRCHFNIQWPGGGEAFSDLVPNSYPSHEIPAAATLLQLFCFCD